MVGKGIVLLRVQYLQQRRGRVAPKIIAQLVNFVQHKERVARPHPAHRLNDAAGQRPDIGAPVAPNFRLIAHAAQAHPHKLAAQGVGNGTAD